LLLLLRDAAHAQNQFNDAAAALQQLFASFDHFPFPRQFVFG